MDAELHPQWRAIVASRLPPISRAGARLIRRLACGALAAFLSLIAFAPSLANAAIVVNPASLPGGTAGTAYSRTVSATGGTGSYAFSVSAGALPAGLSLNAATGVISGTPTGAGASSFTIRATDGIGATGSRAYSVTIAAAIIVNPASLPNGTVGTAYSRTVSATGGTGSKTFSVSAGALPAGLSLNAATGVISGTPTSAGVYNFTIRGTDSIGAIGTRAYSVTINPAIVVNPTTLPGGTLGTAYSQTVSATGGTGSYTYSVSAGSLGAGLTLNASTGVISGTPSTTGTRSFTIRATDGIGATGSRAYSVTIAAAIVVNPATLPGGTVGSAYSGTVSATGGTGSKTFSVSAGALPAGMSLNAATGVISGTPTSAGVSSFHDPGHRQHRRDRHARVLRHDQSGDHAEPANAAQRHFRNTVQPNGQRDWRHRHVHLQRQRRQSGRRARSQRVDRSDLRNADDRGGAKLHDPRDRQQWHLWIAGLQHHDQCSDRGEPGNAGQWDGRNGVQPDSHGDGWLPVPTRSASARERCLPD